MSLNCSHPMLRTKILYFALEITLFDFFVVSLNWFTNNAYKLYICVTSKFRDKKLWPRKLGSPCVSSKHMRSSSDPTIGPLWTTSRMCSLEDSLSSRRAMARHLDISFTDCLQARWFELGKSKLGCDSLDSTYLSRA